MLEKTIHKIRTEAKLTQAQFAELFDVSQQTVQKWESGGAVPELSKIIAIAKYFDLSLDMLVLGNDTRITEEMKGAELLKPQYQNVHDWEFYSSNLLTEFRQSTEEGLDVEAYGDVFSAVSRLPKGEVKKKLGDVLFEVVASAKMRAGHPYSEPSDLGQIQLLRRGADAPLAYDRGKLSEKLLGAWMGRVAGCMLGKTVEGVRTDELIPFLKETGNYPLRRYILREDLAKVDLSRYKYNFGARIYADEIDGMPADDDTNYTVLAQAVVEKYGRDFTPFDMSRAWLTYQGKDAYCTAERVAYCNFVKGYAPPQSALYQNPYREWIGAQIRGDYFGYINPGDPKTAAEMAWRDASISHVKNGIYGEMLVAAMLAGAATTDNVEESLLGGLAEIPRACRLHESVLRVMDTHREGVSARDCFRMIHGEYDEHTAHGWCHTISNAMIVAAALLYGEGDFGRSVCMAVEAGFDTDCNGATVGSVLGMARGIGAIGEEWKAPFGDRLTTTIFGVGTVKISDCAQKTLAHIAEGN